MRKDRSGLAALHADLCKYLLHTLLIMFDDIFFFFFCTAVKSNFVNVKISRSGDLILFAGSHGRVQRPRYFHILQSSAVTLPS